MVVDKYMVQRNFQMTHLFILITGAVQLTAATPANIDVHLANRIRNILSCELHPPIKITDCNTEFVYEMNNKDLTQYMYALSLGKLAEERTLKDVSMYQDQMVIMKIEFMGIKVIVVLRKK